LRPGPGGGEGGGGGEGSLILVKQLTGLEPRALPLCFSSMIYTDFQ
jgi:hypothetical protein